MKNYRVKITYHSKVTVDVEAESEEEALNKAREEVFAVDIACQAYTYDEEVREL